MQYKKSKSLGMALNVDKMESRSNPHSWKSVELRSEYVNIKAPKVKNISEVEGYDFQNYRDSGGTKDYIWLTPDFLESFKSKESLANHRGLSLTSVQYYQKKYVTHLPPLFAERLRVLEEKASKKISSSAKKVYQNDRGVDFEINIRGYGRGNEGEHYNERPRSMDSGGADEKREPHPDDIIESVAKANSVHIDSGNVLPEIRAAPCPIHVKPDRGKGQELLYSSNSHAKSPRRLNTHTISFPQNDQSSQGLYYSPRKTNKFDINIRIPEVFPMKPSLPKKLPSKDFVMTWLLHGSEPTGSNHFPDIIKQRTSSAKVKSKLTPRKAELGE